MPRCKSARASSGCSVPVLDVRLPAGLHEIEAVLDLAEHPRKLRALLRGEAGENLLLPAQQARDQLLVERLSLPRHAQGEFAAGAPLFGPFPPISLPPRRGG